MPKINKGERNKRGSGARMKKEYVKPVIESEEFVANEYVAACYAILGDNDNWFVKKDGYPTDGDYENFKWNNKGFADDQFDVIIKKWYYSGDELGNEGKKPVRNFFGESVQAIGVNIEQITQNNCNSYNCGPNAS